MPRILLPPFGGDKRGGFGIDSIFPNIIKPSPTPLIMSRICKIAKTGKEEKPICCPYCASQLVIRNGTYPRAHPHTDEEVRIQRYLCKMPTCPCVTFSVVPFPFLRVVRHFFATVMYCNILYNVNNLNQAAVVRQLGVTRGVAKRLATFCDRFILWFDHERRFAEWGPAPETPPAISWPDFLRDFSHSMYPGKWPPSLPT